jgi:hypothetical protein
MGHKPIDTITSKFHVLGQERVGRNDQVVSQEMSSQLKFDRADNISKGVQKKMHLKSVPPDNQENKRSYADVVRGKDE